VRGENTLYVRPIDGGAAVRIGEGRARGRPFSRDGNWLVSDPGAGRLEVLPVGIGEPRSLPVAQIESPIAWQPFPDGERVLVLGNEHAKAPRIYEVRLDGATRQISDAPAGWPLLLSNDGEIVAALDADDRILLHSVAGGDVRHANGCVAGDVPIGWTPDDRALYVHRRGRISVVIERVDIETGERTPWHTIRPGDPAGINDIMPVHITPDGQTYAYGYRRFLSDLYVVSGLT